MIKTSGYEFLAAVAPHFSGVKALVQKLIIDTIGPIYVETLGAHAIETPLRIAHFAHESAGFRAMEDFASGAANGNRRDLGNTQPGDGPRFKGRSLLQLIDCADHRHLGVALDLRLEAELALAAVAAIALRIACLYWSDRAINGCADADADADADNLEAVTRRVNGGLNGIDDRSFYLDRTSAALQILSTAEYSTLRLGASGQGVAKLQVLFAARSLGLVSDGVFGLATRWALKAFHA